MSPSTLSPVAGPPRWTRQSGPVVRRARRRRRLLQFTLAVLLLAAVAGAVWVVGFSSALLVRDVRVDGVTGRAAAVMLEAAGIPVGVPMAQVDTGAATHRLAALPWIAAVSVDRQLPETIVISATPRIAVAVQVPTGLGIDEQGRAFPPVDPLPTSLMPIEADGPALDAATATWLALPESLRREVGSVSAASPDDVVLHLKRGPIIRWGGVGRVELKARVLQWLMREPAAVYNVSSPELPATVGG